MKCEKGLIGKNDEYIYDCIHHSELPVQFRPSLWNCTVYGLGKVCKYHVYFPINKKLEALRFEQKKMFEKACLEERYVSFLGTFLCPVNTDGIEILEEVEYPLPPHVGKSLVRKTSKEGVFHIKNIRGGGMDSFFFINSPKLRGGCCEQLSHNAHLRSL